MTVVAPLPNPQPPSPSPDSLDRLDQDLEAGSLRGFWRYAVDEEVLAPRTPVKPHLWQGATVFGALERAGQLVSLEDSARRVVALVNPGLPEKRFTTQTLQLAAQMVLPGEHAPAHRHTIAALRIVVRGHGAFTTVDGQRCVMQAGDVILTPQMTWHEHTNATAEPVVWLDGLNSPLIRALHQLVFQNHPDGSQPTTSTSDDVAARLASGQAGTVDPAAALHFRWPDTRARLEALRATRAPSPHDGYLFELCNPVTGGPALPSIQVAMQLLEPGQATAAHRHSSTTVYHVLQGRGATTIGEATFAWEAGDSFVVPLWYTHAHRAEEEAILVSLSDRPLLQALALYREEG